MNGEANKDEVFESETEKNSSPEFYEFKENLSEIPDNSSNSSTHLNKRKLSPLEWEISSVFIYNTDGLPIFTANYSSSLSQLDSSVVLQFYQTVQQFAENNLETRLVDFRVSDERIFFRIYQDYLFIISTHLGEKIQSGLSSHPYISISALITDIVSILSFDLTSLIEDEESSLASMITELVENVNDQNPTKVKEKLDVSDVEISYVIITDRSGIPLLSQVYDEGIFQDDPMLLGMFMHALNVFFNTNFSDDLNEINFGSTRLYIKNYGDYFYALMIYLQDFQNLTEDSPVHYLSRNLLDNMVELIDGLANDLDVLPEDTLEMMVDNYIFKAKIKLNEHLEKELNQD